MKLSSLNRAMSRAHTWHLDRGGRKVVDRGCVMRGLSTHEEKDEGRYRKILIRWYGNLSPYRGLS